MKIKTSQRFFLMVLPLLVALLLMAGCLIFLPGEAVAHTAMPVGNKIVLSYTGAGTNDLSEVFGQLSSGYLPSALQQDSTEILITKSAPAQVLPGSVYTYTITVENPLTYTLTGVTVGDLLPPDTNFVSVLDNGFYTSTPFPALSWSVGDLEPSASVDVRFVVMAPSFPTTVVNHIYEAGADNLGAYTRGAPVYTVVGDHILIRQIQGSAIASPYVGGDVFGLQGVVTNHLYNNSSSTDADGFYIQDPNPDANSLTSEGVYVYAPVYADTVQVGDAITVSGTVQEYFGLTRISNVTSAVTGTTTAVIAPVQISLPLTSVDDFEAYEGMLVSFPQELVIAEYFNFDRFGEIVLSSERHTTPTAFVEPGAAAIAAAQDYLLDRITLDDGRSNQNPDPAIHPNGLEFNLDNLFRGGDTVQNVTGVMDYAFGLYRIQPTQGADYTNANPRPAQPDEVGGSLKVASFNVLNYFTTLDDGVNDICGPAGDQECRGADNANELARQRAKILAALSAIDADVVGLIEIENHPADVPTADLVSGLNDLMGAGTYDYLATGAIGTDAIRVAFIYKPAAVSLVGDYAVLDTSVDPRFLDDFNRPVLAQTFQENGTDDLVTVAVNHLKSKGSDCDAIGDPDTGDGSGNCNLTRLAAAEALVDWLAGDPTGSGDNNYLIIGDLNSYDKEAPIDAILAGADDTLGTGDDYTDTVFSYLGEHAYSYVFDGQIGYLDHALANAALMPQVTGVTIWHINADEPDLIDYDTSFKRDAQDAIYAPDAYRSSDHDPVLVGICETTAPVVDVTASTEMLWPVNHKYVDVETTLDITDADSNPTITLVSVTSNEPDDGLGDGDTPNDIVIVDDFNFMLRAERAGLDGDRVYTITYLVTDSCGNSTTASVTVTVPHDMGG